MRELTRESIGDALDVYAKHHGSTVYVMPGNECQYIEFDEEGTRVASCLYGHVMLDLGVPMADLCRLEGRTIDSVLKNRGVTDQRLIKAALMSQMVQDTCMFTWSDCVTVFHAILELGTCDGDWT